MTLPTSRRSIITAAAVALSLVAVLLLFVQVVYAAPSATGELYSISSNADCSSVKVTVKFNLTDVQDGSGGGFGFGVNLISGGNIGGAGSGTPFPSGTGAFFYSVTALTPGTTNSAVSIDGGGGGGGPELSFDFAFAATHTCGTTQFFGGDDTPSVTPPTSIWLAHVCEPFDGFSGDGWTTIDSDAAGKPWGTKLYVAVSGDGPWWETEFLQPPYIISQSQMDALAAMVGAASPADMWMRAGEVGTAANYGSMVEDRNAIMDALCGS